MDVDTDNFEAAFALLEQHLPQAAFVAVDLEMTGITGGPETQVSPGDVPQVQYSKARAVVQRPYSIVQLGVCLFEDRGEGHFECRAFNIYTYPRPVDERDASGKQVKTDPFIGMSSGSISFLVQNGLDFQRWVAKGVSHTSAAVAEALLKCIPSDAGAEGAANSSQQRQELKDKKVEATNPNDIRLVKDTMQQVTDFVKKGDSEMQLPDTNSFLALILRQRLAEQHPQLVVEKRPNPSNPRQQQRWVLNMSGDVRNAKNAEIRSRMLAHIGVRRVWDLLKAGQRPVVVHNGFFDLLFLVSAFEGLLPLAVEDFKDLVHKAFPQVFDTKILAESKEVASGRFKQRSSLPELAERIAAACTPTEGQGGGDDADPGAALRFSAPEGFQQYEAEKGGGSANTAAFHTAGYDAFQTGKVFAYFRSQLAEPRLLEFRNRVFLLRSAFDLCLGLPADNLSVDGIVRYLYDMDTAILNNRGLAELLKPLTGDGQRSASFKWCSGGKAMLLVIQGVWSAESGSHDREACEKILDKLLQEQAQVGRLQYDSLEAYLEEVAAAAAPEGPAGDDAEPAAKRRRTG